MIRSIGQPNCRVVCSMPQWSYHQSKGSKPGSGLKISSNKAGIGTAVKITALKRKDTKKKLRFGAKDDAVKIIVNI